jgi:hypothetical protein
MSTTWAIEPVFAIAALWIGKALFFAAFWTLPVHFLMINVIIKQQSTFRTELGLAIKNNRLAILLRADKNRPTTTAEILPLFLFLADRALIHNHLPLPRKSAMRFETYR